MLKNGILTVVLTGLIISGCVTTATDKPQQIAPLKHQIDITVKSENDSKVSIDDEKLNQYTKGDSPEIELSTISAVCFKNKVAFIKLFSGLSVSDVTRTWNDLIFLEHMTDIKDVHVFINSPGGDAFAGLALADQIERAKRKGFKITAHASGIIASAAVPVFAVCENRYAAPGTIFMVHEAALWKWPGRETASDIRSQNELMQLLRERYIGKLTANSKLDKTKWEELEKKTTWFSVQKAMEWGLVDEIR
jgi:ATP-dependent Clp protease protease subunit